MPATVEFPIRVRTDAKALLLGQEDLLGATERALGRALRNARRSVPGGARDSALPAVCSSVRWIGPEAGAIDEPTRAAIEQRLAELIDELVRASAGEEALTPLATRSAPSEPADSARLDPLLGLYTLPSYRDGNDTTVDIVTISRRSRLADDRLAGRPAAACANCSPTTRSWAYYGISPLVEQGDPYAFLIGHRRHPRRTTRSLRHRSSARCARWRAATATRFRTSSRTRAATALAASRRSRQAQRT